MSLAIRRIPWTIKPPTSVPLDRAHWSARKLRALWTFREGAGAQLFDFSSERRTDPIMVPDWSAPDGLHFDGTGNTYSQVPQSVIPTSSSFSIVTVLRCTRADSADIISNNNSQSGRFGFSSVQNSSSQIPLVFVGRTSPGNLILQATTQVNDGKLHTVAMSRNGNTWSIYVDGVREGQTSYSGNIVQAVTRIGQRGDGGGGRPYQGDILHLAICDYALSDAQQMLLHRNPWQIYRGRTVAVPSIAAPGGAKPWLFQPVNQIVGAA